MTLSRNFKVGGSAAGDTLTGHCDLPTLCFFWWDWLKERVYRNWPTSIVQLRELILNACSEISANMCQNVCRSVSRRFQQCDREGAPLIELMINFVFKFSCIQFVLLIAFTRHVAFELHTWNITPLLKKYSGGSIWKTPNFFKLRIFEYSISRFKFEFFEFEFEY